MAARRHTHKRSSLIRRPAVLAGLVLVALAVAGPAVGGDALAAPAGSEGSTLITAPCDFSSPLDDRNTDAAADASRCADPPAANAKDGRITVHNPIGPNFKIWIPNPFDDSPLEGAIKPSRLIDGMVGRLFGLGGKSCINLNIVGALLQTPHYDGKELRHAAHGTAVIAMALLAATMTFAVIHFWLTGIGNFGGTGLDAGQGIVRGVG